MDRVYIDKSNIGGGGGGGGGGGWIACIYIQLTENSSSRKWMMSSCIIMHNKVCL